MSASDAETGSGRDPAGEIRPETGRQSMASRPPFPTALVIVNARAGGHDLTAIRSALGATLTPAGTAWDLVLRDKGESRRDLARQALDDGYPLVVAAGGDGTVAKVADVLTGSDAVLGVLPTGTGNVLARELGIPGDLEAAAGVLAGGRPRLIDAMEVDGGRRRCFSHVSLGTYARIASMDSPDQKRRLGRLAYLRNLYTEVGAGRSWPFHLSVDGSDRQVTASMILVANVAATGLPGLTWSGRAEPDDGVLDVCIVRATTIPGYLRLAAQAMLGRHDEAAGIEYLACRHRLAIEAPADLAVRGDGKELGNGRLDLSVVPRSVAVLVAAGIGAD